MIINQSYYKRIISYTILTLAAGAVVVWLSPDWVPPPNPPHLPPPTVTIQSGTRHLSAEQAAVRSPATIALPGLPSLLNESGNEEILTPPLDIDPSIAVVADSPEFTLAPTPAWRFLPALPTSAAHNRVEIPVDRNLKASPVTAVVWSVSGFYGQPAKQWDCSRLDPAALPLPTPPTARVKICIIFHTDGNVRLAWIDQPTGNPELNRELMRQAYRVKLLIPSKSAANEYRGELELCFSAPAN